MGTWRRSYHPSPTPTNTEWPMTTVSPTSRRQRHRMLVVTLLDPSPSPFLTDVSRPPPTPLIPPMGSSQRFPTLGKLSILLLLLVVTQGRARFMLPQHQPMHLLLAIMLN